MAMLLLRLENLPDVFPEIEHLKSLAIDIRRPLPSEKQIVIEWVRETFAEEDEEWTWLSKAWADECEVAFSNHPISCFIAVRGDELLGFSCYGVTAKNILGPVGVREEFKGHGLGKLLASVALHGLLEEGYKYAIIPSGFLGFYSKIADTAEIEGMREDLFDGMLKNRDR